MSDSDLRALERSVTETGSVEARVRLALAYERAGRSDAVLETLLPARSDPEARRLLDKLPAWNGGASVPYGNGFVDVRALTKPKEVWSFAGQHTDRGWRPVFLASALALVCKAPSGRVVVLDSVTGNVLWQLPEGWPPPQAVIVDQVLIRADHGRQRLCAADLWTGDEIWALPLGGRCTLLECRLVVVEERGRMRCHELRDGRQAPVLAWETAISPGHEDEGPRWSDDIAASDQLVIHAGRENLVAFERATGKVAWTVEEPFAHVKADSLGILAVTAHLTDRGLWDTGEMRALDHSGSTLWRTDGKGSATAIAPSFVLAAAEIDGRLRVVTLDRATGSPLHSLGVLADYGALALVRDAAYVYLYLLTFEPTPSMGDFCLRALNPDGRELWRVSPDELGGDVFGIAPVPGRIFVLGRDGTVTCFTES